MSNEARAVPDGFELSTWESYGPFETLLGPFYLAKSPAGVRRLGFFVHPRHCNVNGIMHGGMLMSVVDSMMGGIVFDTVPGGRVATISITSDFLGSARSGDWVQGEAIVLRKGRTVAFTEARFESGGRLVFFATGKWSIAPAKTSST